VLVGIADREKTFLQKATKERDFLNLNPTATLVISGSHVEGEKRYWLHIALGRDVNVDHTVDVLGAQLEEVTE
jgi:hypothetical protein